MYVSWMCQYVIQHIANPYYLWGNLMKMDTLPSVLHQGVSCSF